MAKRHKASRMTSRPVAFRMPPDLIKAVGKEAARRSLSRNKLVEFVLRQHLGQPDAPVLVPQEAAHGQPDLFA